jgi:hypothetical protein
VTARNVCRRCGDEIVSNYFDGLMSGLGKRGSTFSDVDAISHDEDGDRFLFQEFKRQGEAMSTGQKRLLAGLKRKGFVTVWCLRRRDDGRLDFFDVGTSVAVEVITEHEYRCRVAKWWGTPAPPAPCVESTPVVPNHPPVVQSLTADDINWG